MKKNLVYDIIKNKIITGELVQGENINEKKLSEVFNVSRTPVRGALDLLEKEGWIKSISRKGYVISEITFSDMKDLFQIRRELEPVFLSMAFNFLEVSTLRKIKDKINSFIENKDCKSLRIIDDRFHLYLVESTYNRFAIETMRVISEHISRTRYLTFNDQKETFDSAQDHIDIIDALLDKNLEKAIKILKDHIDKSQLYFLKNFNFRG